MIIAIYGPDGSGKSTVVSNLMKEVDCTVEHFRPNVKIIENIVVTEKVSDMRPYQSKSYGFVKSVLKIFYNFLIFQCVRFRYSKNQIVIFDRYYYDLLVDPARMRLSGFKYLIKILGKFIKKPDLIFVLVGSGEVINSRKNELKVEEINKLCARYKKLESNKVFNVDIDDAYTISKHILSEIKNYEH